MNLTEFLDENLVIPQLTARTKSEVLAELIAPLKQKFDVDIDKVHQVLLEREALGSTGIGNGIAIPHGKFDCIDKIVLVTGKSSEGVDFSAVDNKPAHIFFLVLAPEKVAGMHLRVLASISKLLQDEAFRQAYMDSQNREELWKLLRGT